MNGSFVGLVQHDDAVLREVPVNQTLPQHHTVCHVLYLRLRARTVLKTNRVTDLSYDKRNMSRNFIVVSVLLFKIYSKLKIELFLFSIWQ